MCNGSVVDIVWCFYCLSVSIFGCNCFGGLIVVVYLLWIVFVNWIFGCLVVVSGCRVWVYCCGGVVVVVKIEFGFIWDCGSWGGLFVVGY